ncbi:MAG: hypothetical protein JW974_03380 [Alphaproteobacteria bacterium]|nr:hypothetical protein [Alphaproteobacteria bacterium]MBN2675280.1 hypothetical protein [Alphaproteobacteria bacterium]
MRSLIRFFALVLCIMPSTLLADAPLSGTAGSNLSAYNGGMGSINNNNWNQMMNSRTPAADFGNCNALILRCAQPRCASGGCINMDIAYPIVSGCVLSNDSCKKYGDDLIQYISAQLVASSTAKANEQNANAAQAAAQAASAQSTEQMQQMQNQMLQMQNQLTEQNNQNAANIQAALDEQKQLAAQAAAKQAAAPTTDSGEINVNIAQAASNGISADILAREQASGQIMTQLENAEDSLKALKKTMQNTFDYAGCDSSGNNCTGPKRVAAFKQKAGEFFEPYENTLDEVYDALIMAQSLGVDITDIYMMLNGSCNVWGKYLCSNDQTMHYTSGTTGTCGSDGKSVSQSGSSVIGGASCKPGQVVPLSDGGCQLIQMLNNQEEVQQNWLYPEDGTDSKVRVGCASEALDNSVLFRGRKKQATIDIEVLQRIINQDSPNVFATPEAAYKYCSVTDSTNLQRLVSLKKLPNPVCIKNSELGTTITKTTDCDDETNDTINPELALCSVHVYNIGLGTNPTSAADKQSMKDVIALKTTIMTQQMKKQYDYLETTIKRFKTQLEKAILTSKMEASGAVSESSSSYKSSGNSGIEGSEDCSILFSISDKVDCLQRNWRRIYTASDSGKKLTGPVKKQIMNDSKVVKNLTSLKAEISDECTKTTAPISCISDLQAAIANAAYALENNSKTSSGSLSLK